MTISDFVQRGNPGEGEEDWNDVTTASLANNEEISPKTPKIREAVVYRKISKNTLVLAILLLSASASFGLGYLAGHEGSQAGGLVVGSVPMTTPPSGVLDASALNATSGTSTIPSGGEVVGSSATHAYYLPWCSQASTIANAQKVWFSNEQAAISAGYKAGAGCSGI